MKLVASSSSGCARSARTLAKPASNMTTNLGLSACFSRKSVAMKAHFESYNTTKTTEAPQDDGGFFSSAFKDALATAIERSDDSTLSFASPNTLSKPAYVAPPEPSAQEDMLAAALEASKTSVSRLLAIRNEIERSLEREKMQVERLEFALDKAKKDEAYYRVLKVLQDRGASDLEE